MSTSDQLKRLQGSIDYLISRQALLEKEVFIMASGLQDLKDAVQANSDAVDSAIELINGLADKIDAISSAATELEALKGELGGLTTELRGDAEALGTAVTENTPAEPPVSDPDPINPDAPFVPDAPFGGRKR